MLVRDYAAEDLAHLRHPACSRLPVSPGPAAGPDAPAAGPDAPAAGPDAFARGDLTLAVYYSPGTLRSRAAPPPAPRTKWTRRVPHPVLIGHAASLTPY